MLSTKGEYTSELTILTYNHTLKKKEKKNLGKKSFKAPNKLNTKCPDLANAYGIHIVKHTVPHT